MYSINYFNYGYQIYPAPAVFYGKGYDEWVRVELFMFLVQGKDINLLIDAGMSKIHAERSNPLIEKNLGVKGRFVIEEDPLLLLDKQMKLKPRDIDFIVVTHFHLDHVSNLAFFPDTKFIVSRRGFAEIMAPLHTEMIPEIIVPRDALAFLVENPHSNLILTEDQQEVLPGVEVFWTGGHTLDHQAVLVNTEKGKLFFPADNVPFFRNLEEHIPSGNPAHLSQAYSALKMAEKGDWEVIVPHDPELLIRYPNGRIA